MNCLIIKNNTKQAYKIDMNIFDPMHKIKIWKNINKK